MKEEGDKQKLERRRSSSSMLVSALEEEGAAAVDAEAEGGKAGGSDKSGLTFGPKGGRGGGLGG